MSALGSGFAQAADNIIALRAQLKAAQDLLFEAFISNTLGPGQADRVSSLLQEQGVMKKIEDTGEDATCDASPN